MASRRRLGVALLLDPPLSDEVEGLRRALGDPSLGRVAPHLTLVPPVNVRAAELDAALEAIRGAAGRQPGPLRITLGPPATFLPDNPVVFLDVGGDIERLRDLRDALFKPPLERPLSWPWVPHVTLADGIGEDRILAALASLDHYAAVSDFDRVVILEEARGRFWKPLADAGLGPPVVVGTGGLAVRITRGRLVDPLLLHALGDDEETKRLSTAWTDLDRSGPDRSGPDRSGPDRSSPDRSGPDGAMAQIVLTAHRGGQRLGAAAVRRDPLGAWAAVFVLPDARREGTGGHLLAQLESAALEAGWDLPSVTGEGPSGFYESRSAWVRPAPTPPTRTPPTRTSPRRTGRAS